MPSGNRLRDPDVRDAPFEVVLAERKNMQAHRFLAGVPSNLLNDLLAPVGAQLAEEGAVLHAMQPVIEADVRNSRAEAVVRNVVDKERFHRSGPFNRMGASRAP